MFAKQPSACNFTLFCWSLTALLQRGVDSGHRQQPLCWSDNGGTALRQLRGSLEPFKEIPLFLWLCAASAANAFHVVATVPALLSYHVLCM